MKTFFLLLLIGFSAISCTDRNTETKTDQLPPITQTGANTAGCLVDGKVLIPKNGSQAIGGPPAYGLTTGAGNNFHPPTIGNDYKYFKITNYQDTNSGDLYMYIRNMSQGAGNYVINQSDGKYAYYGDFSVNNNMILRITKNNENKVYYSFDNSGIINISKFDYFAGIYSGTFSATLYNKDNPSEKINITEGRFDINVTTLNKTIKTTLKLLALFLCISLYAQEKNYTEKMDSLMMYVDKSQMIIKNNYLHIKL